MHFKIIRGRIDDNSSMNPMFSSEFVNGIKK